MHHRNPNLRSLLHLSHDMGGALLKSVQTYGSIWGGQTKMNLTADITIQCQGYKTYLLTLKYKTFICIKKIKSVAYSSQVSHTAQLTGR